MAEIDYDSADEAYKLVTGDADTGYGAVKDFHDPPLAEDKSEHVPAFFRQMDLIEEKIEEEKIPNVPVVKLYVKKFDTPFTNYVVGKLSPDAMHNLPQYIKDKIYAGKCAYSPRVRTNFEAYVGAKLENSTKPEFLIISKDEFNLKLLKQEQKDLDEIVSKTD